ncbi:hypothetical protein BGZ70_001720, partial [Mortierella alpina]
TNDATSAAPAAPTGPATIEKRQLPQILESVPTDLSPEGVEAWIKGMVNKIAQDQGGVAPYI